MADNNEPLLDYAIISDPFPLYAKADNSTPPSTLQIVVSNGGTKTVYCSSILISFPIGDLAQSLLEVKSGDASATNWTIQAIDKNTEAALPDGDYATFKATRPDGKDKGPVTSSGAAFIFRNMKINNQTGTSHVQIREFTSTDQGSWPDNPRFTTLPLAKFPSPDIPPEPVQDFHAESADQKQMGQEVGFGDKIVLRWRGPKLEYKIIHGPGAKEDAKVNTDDKEQGDGRFDFTWKGEIYRDTTFQLQYVIADTTHTQTTTVNVRDPRLTGLTVKGNVLVDQAKLEVIQDGKMITLDKGAISSDGKITSSEAVSGASLSAGTGPVTAGILTIQKDGDSKTIVTADDITTPTLRTQKVDMKN
ncbi:hypothetical protein [Kitasatospora purpeofusca]|uniref:hypothetical protein n=1 Tax=Kitasatospora purpeofusca TaxID=67352 RepID=UPI0036D2CBF2